ncbi:MAG: O-antigen ligase family protein [Proteobacteria bacterium]|nr:O-antigen ligase family protein [Pseudomonadota bacterium]
MSMSARLEADEARGHPLAFLRRTADVLVIALFFLLLLVAPLPMGANRDWAWAPMTVVVAVLAIAAAMGLGSRRGMSVAAGEGRSLTVLVACFALMVGIALLQMSSFAPPTPSASFYARAARILGHVHAPVPSLAVDASRDVLLRCLACGLIFALARAFCVNERRARLLLMVLMASAFLVLVYGFLELANHSCFVGDYLKKQGDYVAEFDRCVMSGTFVNSNSFGCFLGMAAIAAIALIFKARRDGRRMRREPEDDDHSLDSLTGKRLALLALAVLFAGGLLFSGSRAAFAATAAGVALLGVVLLRGRLRSRRHLGLLLAGISIAGGLIVILAGSVLLQKVSNASPSGTVDRALIWRTTLDAIDKSPWLGWGLGSFPDIYAVFQPPQIPLANDKAHSTPLETMLELGVPGGMVAMAVVLLPWGAALRSAWCRRRRRYLPAAAFAVSAVPILHSTVDFSLQMPAIAFYTSALLGMGWAQAFATENHSDSLRGARDKLYSSAM